MVSCSVVDTYGKATFFLPFFIITALFHSSLNAKCIYRIGWASYKSKKDPKLPQHHDRIESSSVHVSFISYQLQRLITEESLRILFSTFGVVLDTSIKKSYIDQSINRQCGYGFVHFSISPEGIASALAAVKALNDATIDEVCYKCSISHNLEKHLMDRQSFSGTTSLSGSNGSSPWKTSPPSSVLSDPNLFHQESMRATGGFYPANTGNGPRINGGPGLTPNLMLPPQAPNGPYKHQPGSSKNGWPMFNGRDEMSFKARDEAATYYQLSAAKGSDQNYLQPLQVPYNTSAPSKVSVVRPETNRSNAYFNGSASDFNQTRYGQSHSGLMDPAFSQGLLLMTADAQQRARKERTNSSTSSFSSASEGPLSFSGATNKSFFEDLLKLTAEDGNGGLGSAAFSPFEGSSNKLQPNFSLGVGVGSPYYDTLDKPLSTTTSNSFAGLNLGLGSTAFDSTFYPAIHH